MRTRIVRDFSILAVFLAISLICAPAPAHAQHKDVWAPFQFLLGNWSGVGSGKPGEGVGSMSFYFDLGKKVMIRKNRVEFPPKPGGKSGMVHEDLTVIYPQPGDSTYRAIYFDNEAHVINYLVSFPGRRPSAVFESEGSEKSPRFRLAYEMGSDSLLSVVFSFAPPGGEFQTYTTGKARRSP